MRNTMMKIQIVALCLTATVTPLAAQVTNPAPYCAAGYDDTHIALPHYIAQVKIGTLNNQSGTTQYAAPHYVYYNNVQAPALVKGTSYPLTVTHDAAVSTHFVAVYIDFNKNNSFADPGELVLQQRTENVTNPATANVLIPATATVGTTRMRVMVFEDDDYTYGTLHQLPSPCTAIAGGQLDWGETEDYNVNITAGGGTGIETVGNQLPVIYFPSPVKDYLYLGDVFYGADVALFDLSGRLVAQQPKAGAAGMDIRHLVNGLYFLRITQAGKAITRKLQITH